MKTSFRLFLIFLSLYSLLLAFTASADKLVLATGHTLTGTVLQTNGENILLLTEYGTLNCSRESIKEIVIDRAAAEMRSKTNTLPDSKAIILSLNKQTWSSNLKQIPATIIDKGILKNVPYISFRCGSDYEVNIYGDLDQPAGIEIGVYRQLLASYSAKSNCLYFVRSLLAQPTATAIIQNLNLNGDLKTFDGVTFEVTPPTAEDAYNGWWLSVYSEQKLNAARATDDELSKISVSSTATTQEQFSAGWTSNDMVLARPAQAFPPTITFVDSTGQTVTNAQVVRVIDGAQIVWRQGVSGGVLRLADLPENVRTNFGYDPIRAAAADEKERRRKAQIAADAAQMNADRIKLAQQMVNSDDTGDSGASWNGNGGGGGRVFVRGYTRRDGTYVGSYSRRSRGN